MQIWTNITYKRINKRNTDDKRWMRFKGLYKKKMKIFS